ncbi:hypothetical protein CBS101457_000636 [Exobasidium rhododendri]|nr:hypothetical protein CBS101457_000636 [Exobasidium rhododendri]
MNPLPFFPPPSRALSRLNDKPPPSSSLSRTSTHSNRSLSQMSRGLSSRSTATSSSDSATSQVNNSSTNTSSNNSNSERPQSRKRTTSGTPNADGSRSPISSEGPFSHLNMSPPASSRPTSSGTSTPATTGGRLGTRLPPGLHFDLVRPNEVSIAHRMEVAGYSQEDAASLETLRYRQKAAPHLFLGAFIAMPPPKVSGPLTMAGIPQRKLIAYACGTAASALSARSLKVHTDDEHSWLVCLHSVCVAPEYQRKGLALKLIEEYMTRLRKVEEGDNKKHYECVALLVHEELVALYAKAGFKMLGVSHVNWGSGGWFEMRRYISTKEGTKQGNTKKEVTSSETASSSDMEDNSTPAMISSLTLNSATDDSTSYLASKLAALTTSSSTQEALQIVEEPAIKDATLSDNGLKGAPTNITSTQVLEALKKQGSTQTTSNGGSRNPGTAYSTIMGQTMAAKTAVEDAFFALEARLVDRESGTNLAEIYCPREECACLLLRVKESDWEVAELGPLASANLTLPNSPSPPSAAAPPPPKSLDRVRGALASTGSNQISTPVQAFWCVYSPMAFENIGFSKDDDWTPPISMKSPQMNANDHDGSGKQTPERKKPTKRGSLFRYPSEKRKEKEGKEKQLSMSSTEASSPVAASESVKVKYLLCADCDCGPLGYTVLPPSLQDGKFAQEVGKTLEGQHKPSQGAALQEPPVYLIAADRVRYRFIKN